MTTHELMELYYGEKKEYSYNPDIPTQERIEGAILGAFIGDALGLGCHWIYNYSEFWRDYGPWVDGYTDPKSIDEGGQFEMISAYRYRAGVRAGMSSQSGQLYQVLLETVASNCKRHKGAGEFVESEYVARVNEFFKNELLPTAAFQTDIDTYNSHVGVKLEHGTYIGDDDGIKCFSGRYTNEEVRFNFDYWFNKGKMDGRWWKPESNVTWTSTSEGAQWGVILAALYRDPTELFYKAYDFLSMWYMDKGFITTQLIYIMTVQAFINNVSLEQYENYMIALFDKLNVTNKLISSFDDVMLFDTVHRMAKRDHLIEPKDLRFASLLFGQNCHVNNLVRCAYYYCLKFANDFETGILTAVNSGGQNMSRAALTGGLLGAMVGVRGIPERFITGLSNEARLIPDGYADQGSYIKDLAAAVSAHSKGEIPPLELSFESSCGCYVPGD